ncbi:FAD-binding protein [Xanthobacter autotrophicus DSM 431]|uniref:FAD-dependent oxidoreductase n=1 Tax=Xanthobacter nonsaccharivorans TaxID=3119912 RepID=UPI0037288A15
MGFSSSAPSGLDLACDVLVLGGGPAGTWAAFEAARAGARVVLADKGFCGTSGATAPSGTSIWYVEPDPKLRHAAIVSREALGGFLADRDWSARVLETTHAALHELGARGYPFPVDAAGTPIRVSLQGPEYMRLMRKLAKGAGVRILDHAPALELLVDAAGAVAGARGIRRQQGDVWQVEAGAVVIATGGCAFLSRALGCTALTGDGHLMAAEAGADFSGMEFSNAYAIAADFASVTKTLFFKWATFTDEAGAVIPGAASNGGRSVIARHLQKGRVFAQLDRADGAMQAHMRSAQPNFFLPFDRMGIDPFNERFPITLHLEGTVRGTGGLRIVDETCATRVPGLYAAGDAATRELICGGFTGGGSHNAAWAVSSGRWAGRAAAEFGRRAPQGGARRGAGIAGLRDAGARPFDPAAAARAVVEEVHPFDRNYFRTEEGLAGALGRLDRQWESLSASAPAGRTDVLRTREAAAMTAVARWMYRSALARTESRGMHRRLDHAAADPAQRHLLTSGGLDEVFVARRPAPPLAADAAQRLSAEGIAA